MTVILVQLVKFLLFSYFTTSKSLTQCSGEVAKMGDLAMLLALEINHSVFSPIDDVSSVFFLDYLYQIEEIYFYYCLMFLSWKTIFLSFLLII